jgi:hypothetical protein
MPTSFSINSLASSSEIIKQHYSTTKKVQHKKQSNPIKAVYFIPKIMVPFQNLVSVKFGLNRDRLAE